MAAILRVPICFISTERTGIRMVKAQAHAQSSLRHSPGDINVKRKVVFSAKMLPLDITLWRRQCFPESASLVDGNAVFCQPKCYFRRRWYFGERESRILHHNVTVQSTYFSTIMLQRAFLLSAPLVTLGKLAHNYLNTMICYSATRFTSSPCHSFTYQDRARNQNRVPFQDRVRCSHRTSCLSTHLSVG